MKTLINECYQSHLLWKYMVNIQLILLHTLIFEISWIICFSMQNTNFPSEPSRHKFNPLRCKSFNPNTAYIWGGAKSSTPKRCWVQVVPSTPVFCRLFQTNITCNIGKATKNHEKKLFWGNFWILCLWISSFRTLQSRFCRRRC